ncbi:hypothetical protein E3N88_14585 [Mikania micrantha]|uniref:HAT C-terminal dimerisation domain-containing protein n=1 Tax=Mikania micrantha TaxID=192012 RepID=A0A5N6P4X1_9ASTR|nr:hypothetical protein E3N88_14585 [Mikania micrantha]
MRNAASSSSSSDPQIAFYNLLMNENSKRQRGNTPSSELGRYIATDFLSGMNPQEFMSFDILAWWKGKEDQFPILSAMARDLLSVQASTVASESAFSVSGRVISLRRTRLTPPAVEMSICWKDYLDAAERVQDRSPLEGEMDYESELLQEEVEAGLSEGITDEEEAAYYQVSSGENSEEN